MSDVTAPPQPVPGARYRGYLTRQPDGHRVQVQVFAQGVAGYNAVVDSIDQAWEIIGKFGIGEVTGSGTLK